MHLITDYKINGGDLSTMTPLQWIVVNLINDIILDFKMNNEIMVTI